MRSEMVRKLFLDYFEKNSHAVVQSSPVIPINDPTLLFTNAGMNQFKDIFLGKIKCPYNPPRAVSVQRCIRVSGKHNDLEEVGRDGYHHTFFEMLGNWSFGDYFKEESILWAWELLTKVYGIPADKLYATIYLDDDEAEQIWIEKVGLPKERIFRFDKENYWEMADTGPCGYTTEIHFDWGSEINPNAVPNDSSGRFIELWNIVFMQYFRDEKGKICPLPQRNVDTGMGFERLVAILEGRRDNYLTDIFSPIIEKISEISGKNYSDNNETTITFRVLSDHIRTLAFAIADGVLPGSTGRGYVLRRILRRSARYSRVLGIHEPMCYKLVTPLVDKMGNIYPMLNKFADTITRVIKAEEERFGKTLDIGIELFEKIADELVSSGEKIFPGEMAFKLYDTYGFPLDLTQLMARERGLSVDEETYQKYMNEQRKRARSSAKFDVEHKKLSIWDIVSKGKTSLSLCYGKEYANASVRLIRRGERSDIIEVVLSRTPFYAESGGQVGDTGKIKHASITLKVIDTIRDGDFVVHRCEMPMGRSYDEILSLLREDPQVVAEIDGERRLDIRRNHTATHLLHSALREVLGEHVRQSGSLVAPERLRFDYTHFQSPTREQLENIETIVNSVIMANQPVKVKKTTYKDAISSGAIALFGEKYGEIVRMVEVENTSRELCGGTHVGHTGEIGLFVIVNEESIGSGLRRIEALTGKYASEWLKSMRKHIDILEKKFSSPIEQIPGKIEALFDEISRMKKSIEFAAVQNAEQIATHLLSKAYDISGIKTISSSIGSLTRNELREVMSLLEKAIPDGVIFLIAVIDTKPTLVCRVSPEVVQKFGLKANDVISYSAKLVDGKGGGRSDFAQAGGKRADSESIMNALNKAKEIIESKIKNK